MEPIRDPKRREDAGFMFHADSMESLLHALFLVVDSLTDYKLDHPLCMTMEITLVYGCIQMKLYLIASSFDLLLLRPYFSRIHWLIKASTWENEVRRTNPCPQLAAPCSRPAMRAGSRTRRNGSLGWIGTRKAQANLVARAQGGDGDGQ